MPESRALAFGAALVALLAHAPAFAQIESGGQAIDASKPLLLAVDADDDDEDGVIDGAASRARADRQSLVEVMIPEQQQRRHVAALGGLRVIRHGQVRGARR